VYVKAAFLKKTHLVKSVIAGGAPEPADIQITQVLPVPRVLNIHHGFGGSKDPRQQNKSKKFRYAEK